MTRSGQGAKFLLDNNVFVSAIKDSARETATLRLILKMIQDEEVGLVGNEYLAEEMARYAEVFRSEMASLLLYAMISKMELVEVEERFIIVCRKFMGADDLADLYHAATCLQLGAVLVTNDRHFDPLREEGIIEVWSTAEAIQRLL